MNEVLPSIILGLNKKVAVVGATCDPLKFSFRCSVCVKNISCRHQGERDVTRHI